ncbi:calcium-binding protein [Novosphingobium sp.]|uniref:calcium-binding protein n=1 Tax=Novosphingobium sp. TaxID=1874826 RepID=UPI003D1287BD
MTNATPTSAAAFVASIGVDAAIDYTDGKYANIKNDLADLKYLGVSLIRTDAYFTGMTGQAAYNLAASSGVRFDMLLYANSTPANSVTQLAAFATAHPGSIAAIEGPNEVNNFAASYNGLTGAAAAVAFQNALYTDIGANATLNGTTVYSYTMNAGATSTTGYDYAAIHPYANNANAPQAYLKSNMAAVPAGKPFVVTETGYSTLNTASGGVDGHTQAIYNLDMIFDAKSAGAATVFLYELLDAYADPTGTSTGNHYGLFDYTNTAKPAATALHDLTTILGGGPATYTPGTVSYTISGADATTSSMVLQKSTNTFDVVLWDEQKIWNNTTHTAIAAASHSDTIHFGNVEALINVYDPILGTAPIAVYTNTSAITLTVGADPLILEITNQPAAARGTVAGTKSIAAVASGMTITGTAGATITASGFQDTFAFHSGFGLQQINGFAPGAASHDVLQFDKTLFANYAAVAHAMTQSGANVVIAYDAHDQITLNHETMGQLTSANFVFV